MKSFFVLLIAALVAGCASVPDLSTVDAYGEGAFQVAHLVDVVQTVHGAGNDPCAVEADPTTRALIGAHPSQESVIIWGAGFAAVHYGITAWLLDHDHDRIAAAWEAASVIDTLSVVDHNYSIGIRIGAPNKDPASCVAYFHGSVPGAPTNFHLKH